MKSETQAYLLSEATQAWTHYRHLEESRTKYLSFFATVILAAAGYGVSLLKDINQFPPELLRMAAAIFTFLLFGFSMFIWANIVRIGHVLAAYGVIMSVTRHYMLAGHEPALAMWNIRDRLPPQVSKGMFQIQTAAGYMVFSVVLLLAAIEAWLFWLAAQVASATSWFVVALHGVLLLGMLVIAAIAYNRQRLAKKFTPPSVTLVESEDRLEQSARPPGPAKRVSSGARLRRHVPPARGSLEIKH